MAGTPRATPSARCRTSMIVRIDAERQLLLISGALPGSRGGDVTVRPTVRAARGRAAAARSPAKTKRITRQNQAIMELKLHRRTGRSRPHRCAASDAAFGRAYNESLVHQVITAYLGECAPGNAEAEDARRDQQVEQEAVAAEAAPAARAPAGVLAAVGAAAEGSSRTCRTRTSRTRSTARCTAPACALILSQLAREDRLAVVGSGSRSMRLKTKLLRAKAEGHGPDRRADRDGQRGRQPAACLRATCRQRRRRDGRAIADPVSLLQLREGAGDQGRGGEDRGDVRMSDATPEAQTRQQPA